MGEVNPSPDASAAAPDITLPQGLERRLIAGISVSLVLLDGDGCIRWLNPFAEHTTGYTTASAGGWHWLERLIPAEERPAALHHYRQILAGRRANPLVASLVTRQGQRRLMEWSVAPLAPDAPDASQGGILCTGHDITHQRAIAGELAQTKAEAERANVDKTRFLAAASHDLRQPLQTLKLLNGILQRGLENPALRDIVARQERALQSATLLLDNFLAISRLDASGNPPAFEALPVADLFRSLEGTFAPQARAKGLSFKAMPSRLWVHSDSAMLHQILASFLANALQYTHQGGVVLGARRRGDHVALTVLDSGVGIAAHQHQAIFQDFVQLDNPHRDRNRGLGLGLAMARRLARNLGHSLEVSSRPGSGSRFAVVVHRERPPGPPRSPHVTTGDRPPGLLWLIEDDQELLEATSLLLKSHGYRVQTFTSGDDAVAAAEVAPTPQLVISDYLLPGAHSGLDTIYQLRQRLDAALPALIVTGAAERLVGGTGLDNVAVMSKPIQLQRLQAAIRRLLAADCGATG